MPDEVTPTNNEQTPEQEHAQPTGDPTGQPTGAQPQGRTFTQDDLDKIVAKRVSKAERAAEKRVRQELAAKLKGPEAKPEPQKTGDDFDAKAEFEKMRAELHFEKLTLGKNLTDEQIELAKRISDPVAQKQLVDMYDQTNKAAQTEAADNDAPIYVSPGVGSAPPAGELEHDATKWSNEQIAQWREDGSFLSRVEQYRNRLAGGANRIFSKRPIKVPK